MSRIKKFPIQSHPYLDAIPWSVIEPHEKHALKNHEQTLKRLAERGGCNAPEVRAIVQGRELGWIINREKGEDDRWLMELALFGMPKDPHRQCPKDERCTQTKDHGGDCIQKHPFGEGLCILGAYDDVD